MSWIDRYAEYKANKSNPADTVFRRLWDPDFLTPDMFFTMDEIKGRQVLRQYEKSESGDIKPTYLGTYLVVFKTEDLGRFCLIMKRINDEWPIPEKYSERAAAEEDNYIVAEYYPGIYSRIYLRGLSAEALDRVVKKYERRFRKKLPLK